MYLLAIVMANLSVAWFGPSASIANAFLFIGFDLTARDKLHDGWRNRGLVWKMAALIVTGAALTVLLNRNAGQIAVASTVAFAVAAIVDAVVYHKTGNINVSNVFSAAADSLLFPWIAFGGIMPWVTLGQWVSKVFGGIVWAWIIQKMSKLSLIVKQGKLELGETEQ